MKYRLQIEDSIVNVEVRQDMKTVSIGDKVYTVDSARISENHIHLTIDDKNFESYVADTDKGKIIMINGKSCIVYDADEIKQDTGKTSKDIPKEITPPMPSVVVRILVTEGGQVSKGDGIIVVSAMKMENTLLAPFDCIVNKINVKIGDKVMPGQILADIAPKNQGKPKE